MVILEITYPYRGMDPDPARMWCLTGNYGRQDYSRSRTHYLFVRMDDVVREIRSFLQKLDRDNLVRYGGNQPGRYIKDN